MSFIFHFIPIFWFPEYQVTLSSAVGSGQLQLIYSPLRCAHCSLYHHNISEWCKNEWADLAACLRSRIPSSAIWPSPLYHLRNPLTNILLWTLAIHSSWLSKSASVRRLIHWKNTLKSQISWGTISNGAIICCIAISFALFVSRSWKSEFAWEIIVLKPDDPLHTLFLCDFSFASILQNFFCCADSIFIL